MTGVAYWAGFLSPRCELHQPLVLEHAKTRPLYWFSRFFGKTNAKESYNRPQWLSNPCLRCRSGSSLLFTPSQFCGLVHASCFCLDAVDFLRPRFDVVRTSRGLACRAAHNAYGCSSYQSAELRYPRQEGGRSLLQYFFWQHKRSRIAQEPSTLVSPRACTLTPQ